MTHNIRKLFILLVAVVVGLPLLIMLLIYLAQVSNIFEGLNPFVRFAIIIGFFFFMVIAFVGGLVTLFVQSARFVNRRQADAASPATLPKGGIQLSVAVQKSIAGALMGFAAIFIYHYVSILLSRQVRWWENIVIIGLVVLFVVRSMSRSHTQ